MTAGGLCMVWRLKVDLANRWLLTTDHRGGLRVTDLDTNDELWSISPLALRPFAHLEYQDGPDATIVVDRFSDELEVWRLDPDAGRGHFQLVGLVDSMPNMRGYHLKAGTLAIVTSTGRTAYYDLMTPAPTHLRTLQHAAGPIGYLDKTPSTLVLCHGSSIRCYDPVSAAERGHFPPGPGTPLMHYHVHRPQAIVPPARVAAVEITQEGVKPFVAHPLDPTALDGDGGEWQACHVDGLYLVALSKKNRVFVCTSYEAVLASDDAAERERLIQQTCCVFDVDRLPDDGDDEDADGTNWLSVLNGRAAFGARCVASFVPAGPVPLTRGADPCRPAPRAHSDHLLLMSLPRPHLNTYAASAPIPQALGYPMDPDVPPSCIQLTADAVFFTARDFMRKVVVGVWNDLAPVDDAVELVGAGDDGQEDDEWEDTDIDD